MSDDLVSRLKSPEVFISIGGMTSLVAHEAADHIEAQAAEITRLRAEIATARREGMEEAAQIAESEPELPGLMPAEFEKHSRETLARAACIATKRGIVAAIRAAAKEGKP